MSISNEVVSESQDAYDLFKVAMGESFAPYSTPTVEEANLKALSVWGTANLSGGIAVFTQLGAYQIAFRQCLANGTLQRDPNWRSREERKSLFVAFNNSLPGAISKAIYTDATYTLSEEQAAELKKIGGVSAFKRFMDEV